jgi:LysM repeat protein
MKMKKSSTTLTLMVLTLFLFSCAGIMLKKVSVVGVQKEEQVLRDEVEVLVQTATVTPIPSAIPSTYIVMRGDSLWKISYRMYGNGEKWEKIALENNIASPFVLQKGMILTIPVKDPELCSVPTPGKTPTVCTTVFNYRVSPNVRAFGVGEKLVFAVKYFNVTAGFGILEIEQLAGIKGHRVYKLAATATTSSFFDNIYRVHDRIESYIDVMGLFSWKYAKKLEEGGYRGHSELSFDHEKGIATKQTGETYPIKSFVQDVLSELYYYRTFDLSKGKNDEVYIDVCADDGKSYQILVNKLRYETVTVDAGTFDCVVVQPHLKYEGIFKQAGDVIIWLTNDANKIPVKVESKIAIGSINAELQNATVVRAN